VRRRIREIVLEREREQLIETALRLVHALSIDELALVVADWLDAQTAI
jgi:hypothetical protein